jgi:hypothetical protein
MNLTVEALLIRTILSCLNKVLNIIIFHHFYFSVMTESISKLEAKIDAVMKEVQVLRSELKSNEIRQ